MRSSIHLAGDAVQVALSLSGDEAAALGVLLHQVQLLEGLQGLAVDGTGGVLVARGASTAALLAAVDEVEGADADTRSQVDFAGDGCSADVEPVRVVRGQLLGRAGLDQVNPGRDGDLSGALQVGSVGIDELLGVDVLDTYTSHWVKNLLATGVCCHTLPRAQTTLATCRITTCLLTIDHARAAAALDA